MDIYKLLPVEILDIVFDTIANSMYPFNDLRQCQLTCKNWSEPAQEHLYKSVTLYEHEQFMKLLTTLCYPGSKSARHLKSITIKYDHVSLEGLFRLLLLRCPNIKTLYTVPMINHRRLFEEIRQACDRGGCRRLERVIGLDNSSALYQRMYINTMYYLRNSLRDLSLDEDYMVRSNDPTHSPWQILNEFQGLRTLNVKMNNVETFYRLGKCTKTCSNLEKLELFWDPRVYPNEDMISDIHCMTAYPTVKHLSLSHVHITKQMLEYIIHEFPNLDILTIFQPIILQSFYNTIPNSLWLQFLAFLQNIKKKVSIERLYFTDIPDVIADYFNTRKSNARLRVFLKDSMNEQSLVDIKHERKQSGDRDTLIEVQLWVIPGENESPFLTLLRRTGGFLKSFDARACRRFNFIDRSFLDIICQKCSSLEQLQLDSFTIITDSALQRQTNASIKEVSMSACNFSQELFPEFSIRFPSLSNLSLIGCCLEGDVGIYHHNYYNVVIKMPYTAFDTLAWSWPIYWRAHRQPRWHTYKSRFYGIVLRIDTSAKSYYYLCNKNGDVIESTGASFQKSWDIKTILSFYIQCKEIKKFKLTLGDRSWKIAFTRLQKSKFPASGITTVK
jgi:hypothetical protein